MKSRIVAYSILCIWMFLTAVPAGAAAGPTVFVSIVPQKFFVQHIGGDHFDVEVMVQPGASPHTYEPKPSQMRKLAAARAYFTIGVALEDAWLDKISTINPDMKVVHTEAGIVRMKMVGDHHDGEGRDSDAKGEGRAHDGAEGLDPHIWLSPELVKVQAKTITDSLVELDPDREQKYRENYSRFIALVDELDARLRSILAGKTGMKFMVFHPSWGYFARSYGLTQVAVEIEGKSPKPASLKKLIDQARAQQIRVIFAQPQFSRKSAEMIAREIDGEVVLIDPLAEDWGANMVSVADTLSRALR
jgi:zinc transport system substrate-binding protein